MCRSSWLTLLGERIMFLISLDSAPVNRGLHSSTLAQCKHFLTIREVVLATRTAQVEVRSGRV